MKEKSVEQWPVEKPIPYARNARIIPDQAIGKVAASIKEFGFRAPILVDGEGVIIAGHTRLLAAQRLGLEQVPVIVCDDLTDAQVKAYRLADNRTAQETSWDYELLNIELEDLSTLDIDVSLTGFDGDELAGLQLTIGSATEVVEDDAPEPPEEPVTKAGDLWLLGKHRLLCGDSTDGVAISRLMEGVQARMMFTDPPWNVAIGLDSNPRHRQRAGLTNDDLPAEQFQAFLDGFVKAVGPHVSGDLYCVLGASEWPRLDATLRSHGYHWSATVIWVKDVFVLGRSKYHRRYEPIWYGWHNSATSSFGKRRDLDDVWEIARPRRSKEHPTMKPVEVPARAIAASSRNGDVIVDPFGGSGSTLVAAEQLGRLCYTCELDPGYCDVIVNRWQNLTGQKATLDGTNLYFDETRDERCAT